MTKDNKPVNDAKIMVRITRPYTKYQYKDLKVISKENGSYKLSSFNIDSIGRWQILAKVTVGDLTSFTKTDINATK
jgi:nitrogen fixation protein FixH